jgi:nucleotide-binding universal stress UspA family protein
VDDRPLLICFDASEDGGRAIAAAAALFAGRRAVVLDVAPLEVVAEAYAAVGSNAAELDRLAYDAAVERARSGAERARAAGLRAVGRGEVDSPAWRGITEVADEIDAAVIVIGSRGLAGARSRLAGSVSHEVATHAGRPVLVVPPPR